jgi:hypothetical protein
MMVDILERMVDLIDIHALSGCGITDNGILGFVSPAAFFNIHNLEVRLSQQGDAHREKKNACHDNLSEGHVLRLFAPCTYSLSHILVSADSCMIFSLAPR